MTIRVLQVLTTNGRRGAETSALLLRDELRARGIDADAVALAAASEQHNALPVPVLGSRRLGPATLRQLRRRARAVDVVIAHGSTTLPACSVALARTSVPFVYVNIGDLAFWAGSGARHLRTRLLLNRPAVIAARSNRSARTLREDFGIPDARIAVVPNGRPELAFPEVDDSRRRACRSALSLPLDAPVIVWVGALSEEKRPDVAVRCVARFPGAQLLMAGDGPLRATVEQLADDLMPGRLQLLGAVDDVAGVYGCADVALLTSDSEGLPGVLIEAGLSGLPCVATDVGFVSDIVVSGRTGLLAASGDDVALGVALRAAYDRRRELGRNARERCVAAFSLAAVGDRWEALITSLIHK